MSEKRGEAAVFILLGQSNAVGHGIPMAEEDKIKTPLKNVFGLSRAENQSFEGTALRWSGYTSGGMNLGETQDDTWSLANALALRWQAEIDGGAELPDLYVVQIAIGAQGVTEGYMWHPDRAPKLVPGPLGRADISLYPFARHILSLLPSSLGNRPARVLGIHWRGGENDVTASEDALKRTLKPLYERIFGGFREALGWPDCPIILHRALFGRRCDELDATGARRGRMEYINAVFDELAAADGHCSVFDHRAAPFYRADLPQEGIFEADKVHYTPETNRWAAAEILRAFQAGLKA